MNGLFRHFVCFEKFHSPVSELIHLARCVKLNPHFFPGVVLIVFCGMQSNRRTHFIPWLAGFNPRLALIVFLRNRGLMFFFSRKRDLLPQSVEINHRKVRLLKPSHWDRLKLNPHTTFVVEVEGVIDVYYTSTLFTVTPSFMLMHLSLAFSAGVDPQDTPGNLF